MNEEARSEKTTVFVSDPSVEAERIMQALRAAEFHVVDVPLAMLVARVAVQRPRVVIIDADADGALDAIARMRELPDAESIDVVFIGRPGAALAGAEDALAHEGSGFFPRPVNVPTLTKKIESLVAATAASESDEPPAEDKWEPSEPPPPRLSSRPPASKPPSVRPSRPPPSRPPSVPPGSLRGGPNSQRIAPPSVVSKELAELLSRAEEKVEAEGPASDAPVPSPEEEIQAVLPEDVLAALDAPIEGEEGEDEVDGGPSRVTTSGGRSNTTGVRGEPAQQQVAARPPSLAPEPLTHDGSNIAHQTQGEPVQSTTGSTTGVAQRAEGTTTGATVTHRPAPRARSEPAPAMPGPAPLPFTIDPSSAVTTPPRRASSIPPPPTHVQAPSALSTTLGSELLVATVGMIGGPVPAFGQAPPPQTSPLDRAPSQAQSSPLSPAPSTYEDPRDTPPLSRAMQNQMSARAGSPEAMGPVALGPADAPRVLAQAIADRQTGAVTIETPAGAASHVRRIVIREGDIVTAASGVDTESLLSFLGARGDLPRERVEALAGRLPPYGRHAGAALVAQGALGQEQLWPVLRAHAEYLMGQAMLVTSGTALLEPDPPGRLKTEPSVFGGAPGAEIFVEVVRRIISNADALRRCGGGTSVVGEGARAELLRECGLGAAENDAIRTARGMRLDALIQQYPDTDIASVLYALWLLGVVEMVRSVLERPERESKHPDVIDEEAIRDRIRARMQLVEEGDYFALLGVPHNATGYEVKRAYLDLRRAFEPSRVLTPALVDLAEDVRRITLVLEEAYEILGDNARRERYRRAIDASPEA
jgi:hypothetical protein